MCMCAICVKEIHVFECGLVFLCMLPVYGPMADTVEVKLPICKYIYIHTVFDLIWTDQWIDIIESVDVLIQFTPFAHLLCQHYDMLVVPHTPTPSF